MQNFIIKVVGSKVDFLIEACLEFHFEICSSILRKMSSHGRVVRADQYNVCYFVDILYNIS